MTVHAAKGLEFPITVVTGMTTEVRRQLRHVRRVVRRHVGARREGQRAVRGVQAARRADGRRRAPPPAVRGVHAGRRPPRRVAAPQAAGTPRRPRRGRRARTSCRPRRRSGTGRRCSTTPQLPLVRGRRRTAGAAVARSRRVATHERRPGDGRRSGALGDERDRPRPGARRAGSDDGARERAPSRRAPTPGWPRTASTSTCRRGSAGATARPIGRAVHAVLQDADLATGADIDVLAEAQCAAEGIFGLEDHVAALCRSALAAPIVAAAAAGAEHWRELFVVAELGAHGARGLHRPPRAHARRPRDRRLQDRPVARRRRPAGARRRATATSSPPTAGRSAGCSTSRSPAACSCAAARTVPPSRSPLDRLARARSPRSPPASAVADAAADESAPAGVLEVAADARAASASRRAPRAARSPCARTKPTPLTTPVNSQRTATSAEHDPERHRQRQQQRPQQAALGVQQRTDDAGVDGRAVDVRGADRVDDRRARDVALRGGDHVVAAELRLGQPDRRHQHAGVGVDAGPDRGTGRPS